MCPPVWEDPAGNSVHPVTRGTHRVGPLPRATWATLAIPKAGLPPQSFTVCTAYEQTPNWIGKTSGLDFADNGKFA